MSTTARMRAFVAVADTGSVRAAAARLFVTESSVSASIAALARGVGVDIVRHGGRSIRLTAAGDRYAPDAGVVVGLHARACAQRAARTSRWRVRCGSARRRPSVGSCCRRCSPEAECRVLDGILRSALADLAFAAGPRWWVDARSDHGSPCSRRRTAGLLGAGGGLLRVGGLEAAEVALWVATDVELPLWPGSQSVPGIAARNSEVDHTTRGQRYPAFWAQWLWAVLPVRAKV